MMLPDTSDRTGMYSKPGRVSVEMFQMLQLKDEILYNKKKTFQQNIQEPEDEPKNAFQQQLLHQKQQKNQKKDSNQVKGKNKTVDPMGKIVSRDQRDNIGLMHRQNQGFGLYNPKYHLIFEKSQLYMDPNLKKKMEEENIKVKKKQKHMNSVKSMNNISEQFSNVQNSIFMHSISICKGDYGQLNDWSKQHVDGPCPLNLQVPRKPFAEGIPLHENRFEYLDVPTVSSKHRKPISFDIGLKPNRKHYEKFDHKFNCLDYNPNYSLQEKKVISHNQSKRVARKNKVNTGYCTNESIYEVENYNNDRSMVFKKLPGVNVEKQVSRHKAQVVQSYQLPEIVKVK